jgi:hypothetical protein
MKSYKIISSNHLISKSQSPLLERLNKTTKNQQITPKAYNKETFSYINI